MRYHTSDFSLAEITLLTRKRKHFRPYALGRICDPEEVSTLLQWLIFGSSTPITGALIRFWDTIEF